MTYAITRMTKTACATFDNDAKACYDRNISTLISLRSQQLGMPKAICNIYTRLLNEFEYHVKTGAGITDDFYTNSPTTPCYGAGQGCQPAGAAWCIISILLIDLVKLKSPE